MKTALVLEGGAMRGLFTAGVIDALLEENIAYGSFGANKISLKPQGFNITL